jgi:hypothetical protein
MQRMGAMMDSIGRLGDIAHALVGNKGTHLFLPHENGPPTASSSSACASLTTPAALDAYQNGQSRYIQFGIKIFF